MTRVIFHHPLPIDSAGASGSSIRPLRMLQAFEGMAEVWSVSGDSNERAVKAKQVSDAMKAGVKFDLMYSESSTLPTALTDEDRIPRHPILDPMFFKAVRKHRIPIGLFYRDVYWRFPGFAATQSWARRRLANAAFRYDLAWYRKYLDVLYLPSLPMGEYVPGAASLETKALPPGTLIREISAPSEMGPLEVLYVGGIGEMYDLRVFVEALGRVQGLRLTICTRPEEWQSTKDEYLNLMGSNTRVIHQSGAELHATMAASHVATACVQPNIYRSFAAPVKLFDGIGMGIPMVASRGTHAGDIVSEAGLGWSVDYTQDAIAELFSRLVRDRGAVSRVRDRVLAHRHEHTWRARADQVVSDLTGIERLRAGGER